MIQGDCLNLMREMPEAAFDAIITDPPYSSGSSVMNSKSDPRDKYNLSQAFPSFRNDSHDQRIHMLWTVHWLTLALRITRPGGWLMAFSDWRQLPLVSDAMPQPGLNYLRIIIESPVIGLALLWPRNINSPSSEGHFISQQPVPLR